MLLPAYTAKENGMTNIVVPGMIATSNLCCSDVIDPAESLNLNWL